MKVGLLFIGREKKVEMGNIRRLIYLIRQLLFQLIQFLHRFVCRVLGKTNEIEIK